MQKECKKGTRGLRPISWIGQPRRSPSRGHGTNTVVPRRRASNVIDGALGQLRYSTALNIGGCTQTNADGVRRLCDGLLPLKAEIQSNPEQPETSQSSRIPTPMVQVGVRGESQRNSVAARLYSRRDPMQMRRLCYQEKGRRPRPGRLSVPFAVTKGTT